MVKARPPLDGGTVLVTGASSGIGRELAVQPAARAKTLALVARRTARLEELRATLVARHPQLRVVMLGADLSDEADVERVIGEVRRQAGPVDILVNNASVGDQALFGRGTTRKSHPARRRSLQGDRDQGRRRFLHIRPARSAALDHQHGRPHHRHQVTRGRHQERSGHWSRHGPKRRDPDALHPRSKAVYLDRTSVTLSRGCQNR